MNVIKYVYYPDSYNNELISLKFKNSDEFLKLQVVYRFGLETIINTIINFKDLDMAILSGDIVSNDDSSKDDETYSFIKNNLDVEKIPLDRMEKIIEKLSKSIEDEGGKIDIPKIDDNEYNFYHKYSKLGSDYIYLRNNIHIENLSNEDINKLRNNKDLNKDFYLKTIKDVLFESGDECYFGLPVADYLANSKSIVFELAFDHKKCNDVRQSRRVNKAKEYIYNYLNDKLVDVFNIPVSVIVYSAIPNLYVRINDKDKFKEDIINNIIV